MSRFPLYSVAHRHSSVPNKNPTTSPIPQPMIAPVFGLSAPANHPMVPPIAVHTRALRQPPTIIPFLTRMK